MGKSIAEVIRNTQLRGIDEVIPVKAIKAYGGRKSISPLILNPGTRWRCAINFTPRSFYPRRNNSCTPSIGGWVGHRAGPEVLKNNLLPVSGFKWAEYHSRYSERLLAGRDGVRIPVGASFCASVQTGPGAHPAPCTMGSGYFPGVKSGRSVTLIPHPLPVTRSRKSRVIPLLPLWAVRPVQSLSACTRVHFNFYFSQNSNPVSSNPQSSPVFLNRRAAARYRALASTIPGRERFSWNLSFQSSKQIFMNKCFIINILRRKIFVNVSKNSDPDVGLRKLQYATRFHQSGD